MFEQISIFEEVMENYKIEKPIRLIEFFAGIGAQAKALEVLGVKFEHWKTCEWAYNSIIAYNSIHMKDSTDYAKDMTKEQLLEYLNGNISLDYNKPADLKKKSIEWLKNCYNSCKANNNLMNIMNVHGDDLQIEDQENNTYLLTYSFPCQDLSLAGKRAGMSTSQAEGGTRSGLLWEVERILKELHSKGKHIDILLMENVPQVIQSGSIKDFQKWRYTLEQLGYTNYCEVLNAKDYGIPQNRQRCFMVSILGNYHYSFPLKVKLKYKLKDLEEENVDEKYYLSEKMIDYIAADNDKWTGNNDKAIINKEIGCTLNTAPCQRRCDASNYICDELPENADLKKVINIGNYGKGHHAKDIISEEGLMPTITTGNHSLGQTIAIKNNNSKGYELATEGDGIDISTRMESHRGTVQKGSCQTLTCQGGNNVGVVVNERVEKQIVKDDTAHTILTNGNFTGVGVNLIKNENLRIRKLTPLECMKLMAFEEKDYMAMREIGLTDSAIYHCAGDSIVVTCLIGIIGNLIFEDKYKVINCIENYVERVKN